jgi:hypothetical protein
LKLHPQAINPHLVSFLLTPLQTSCSLRNLAGQPIEPASTYCLAPLGEQKQYGDALGLANTCLSRPVERYEPAVGVPMAPFINFNRHSQHRWRLSNEYVTEGCVISSRRRPGWFPVVQTGQLYTQRQDTIAEQLCVLKAWRQPCTSWEGQLLCRAHGKRMHACMSGCLGCTRFWQV